MINIAIVEDNREQAAALESHIKTYASDHKLSVSVSIFYEPIGAFHGLVLAVFPAGGVIDAVVSLDLHIADITGRETLSIFYEPITFLEKYSPFHIVYMDIMMPMLNGMDAAKLLREKDEKVILILAPS